MFDLDKPNRIEKEFRKIIAAEVEEATDIQDEVRTKIMPSINKRIKESIGRKTSREVQKDPCSNSQIEISWQKDAPLLNGMTLDERKALAQEMSINGRPVLDMYHFDRMLRRMLRDRRLENAAKMTLTEDELTLWTLRRGIERQNQIARSWRKMIVKPETGDA